MVDVQHNSLTGTHAVHPFAFKQSTDPGAVGAGKGWVDTSSGPPYSLKIRNAANTGWDAVGATSGGTVAAADVTYAGSTNLAATNVEAALDELDAEKQVAGSYATATDLTNHLGDATDAHDASAISYVGGTGMSATDVEAAVDELATEKANAADLTAHTGDPVDAHDASAISFSPTGSVASTDVQGAIAEVAAEAGGGGGTVSAASETTAGISEFATQTETNTGTDTTRTVRPVTLANYTGITNKALASDLTAHVTDAVDAHDASAVSFAPYGSVVSTDVQGAIEDVIDGAGSGVADLDDLSDVVITSPATNQGIFHNGANFVNGYLPSRFVAPQSVSGTVTASLTQRTYIFDTSGGAGTLNLPTAVGNAGQQFFVKKATPDADTVTIDANGSQTIDGALTVVLDNAYEGLTITSDGANWHGEARPYQGVTTIASDVNFTPAGTIASTNVQAAIEEVATEAGGGPTSTRVTLGADVSNSATTRANVTGLSFSVVSGTTYQFRFFIVFDAQAATTGSWWGLTGPTITYLGYRAMWPNGSTTLQTQFDNAFDSGTSTTNSAKTTGNVATIEGAFTAGANGTLIARFASEAPGTNNQITAKANISYVDYW